MAKKQTEKFDALETPWLVNRAKGLPLDGIPSHYMWIDRLTPTEARNELLHRFERVIVTILNVCMTGRPNFFSWPQRSFLKMFGYKTTSPHAVAAMLKKQLSMYEKDELRSAGQLAILEAIKRTNTNLVSTIVICLKELIYEMIQDGQGDHLDLENCTVSVDSKIEDQVALSIFLENLTEEEWLYAQKVLDDKTPDGEPPPSLVLKFKDYLG